METLSYEYLGGLIRRWRAGETQLDTEATIFPLPALRALLAQTRADLQRIPETWSQQELIARPPVHLPADDGEDLWSATEIITHLIATQNWYMLNIGRLLGRRERFEVMPRGLGDHASNDIDASTLATQLQHATATLLDYVDGVPADAELSAQRDSTFFGMLSLRGWVLLACVHDHDHLAQIGRLKHVIQG